MTRDEMHVLFRQLAQQMGMQNVRAILPEQIDSLINTSISDIVNQITSQYFAKNNNANIEDNQLNIINALQPLYKVSEGGDIDNTDIVSQNIPNDCLKCTDLGISYTKLDTNDNIVKSSKLFQVRLYDNRFLPEALNDDILKPKYYSPIGVINIDGITIYGCSTDEFNKCSVRITYIKKPNKIASGVNCDLAEYLHEMVVKQAVSLWQQAITNDIASGQTRTRQNAE